MHFCQYKPPLHHSYVIQPSHISPPRPLLLCHADNFTTFLHFLIIVSIYLLNLHFVSRMVPQPRIAFGFNPFTT